MTEPLSPIARSLRQERSSATGRSFPRSKATPVPRSVLEPARQCKEIGFVLSLGRWFASDGDNYHKRHMAAAQLGADAVIVQGLRRNLNGTTGSFERRAELRSNTHTDRPSCFTLTPRDRDARRVRILQANLSALSGQERCTMHLAYSFRAKCEILLELVYEWLH
jgi:hypothetical protein